MYSQINQEKIEFANKAAKHFSEHPEHSSFTEGKIEGGCLFGLRWGLGDDCVLVFRLDYDEPLNFTNIIKKG